MLLELMNRWSRQSQLLSIVGKYHQDVTRAYLAAAGRLDNALKERDRFDEQIPPEQQQQDEQQKQAALQAAAQAAAAAKAEEQKLAPAPFHIIQASHPTNEALATVATNWLVGLFEPEKDVAFTENWPETPVEQSGREITIDGTIVTKTNNLNLLGMYKNIRPQFEEVFFVVANRADARVAAELCGYKNVLCIEENELLYNNEEELHGLVRTLTEKFRERYQYYFGENSDWLVVENELNAMQRLGGMTATIADMATAPVDVVDSHFGVHGGGGVEIPIEPVPEGGAEIPIEAVPIEAVPEGGAEEGSEESAAPVDG
eukprot:CAMPEP_0183719434 /NCGR_PEP_ID=MMETSP0737-20130205/12375_1 /TAXON_ID=385413 /ORGANISM="Thalassiosira miniscula, Strain CCMP1093" /LENGTH=315 /DNA_ID=CAMNT_0025949151 /DNA_START=17 /DNA_END=964 /DNA_ORIENTATION=-